MVVPTVINQAPAAVAQEVAQQPPVYAPLEGPVGQQTIGSVPKDSEGQSLPDGTRFALAPASLQNAPWVSINENTGALTMNPPEGTQLGTYSLRVAAYFPEAPAVTVDASVVVVEAPVVPMAESNTPVYLAGSGRPGEAVQVASPTFDDPGTEETGQAPEGTAFSKGENAPDYATVNEDGSVTVNLPEGAEPGTPVEVLVVVTYQDDSIDNVMVTVNVTALEEMLSQRYQPAYAEFTSPINRTTASQAPKDNEGKAFPSGTRFVLSPRSVQRLSWVRVDEITGVITATSRKSVRVGHYTARVAVHYPDGSTDTVNARVVVV